MARPLRGAGRATSPLFGFLAGSPPPHPPPQGGGRSQRRRSGAGEGPVGALDQEVEEGAAGRGLGHAVPAEVDQRAVLVGGQDRAVGQGRDQHVDVVIVGRGRVEPDRAADVERPGRHARPGGDGMDSVDDLEVVLRDVLLQPLAQAEVVDVADVGQDHRPARADQLAQVPEVVEVADHDAVVAFPVVLPLEVGFAGLPEGPLVDQLRRVAVGVQGVPEDHRVLGQARGGVEVVGYDRDVLRHVSLRALRAGPQAARRGGPTGVAPARAKRETACSRWGRPSTGGDLGGEPRGRIGRAWGDARP